MLRLTLVLLSSLFVSAVAASPAAAQDLAGCKVDSITSASLVRGPGGDVSFTGTDDRPVHISCDDVQFFAARVQLLPGESRLVASGDVVFITGKQRISAERVEFDTRKKTGTFYKASGTMHLSDSRQIDVFGGSEPYAFFWGEELQKIGESKYRIVEGAFTTCVQPTPRWEIASKSITINLDDYVVLRHPVFRVKGVPILYLPAFYYPIQEDERATGFLMPIYGTSTLRGQSVSAPFFWAINRSQDVTVSYDWFSRAGQSYTGEYRLVTAPGSGAEAAFNLLRESEVTEEDATPEIPARAAQRAYTVRGRLSQELPLGLRAQGSANYFSSLSSQQRYQQDVYQATLRDRRFELALSGSWNGFNAGLRYDRQDYFYTDTYISRQGYEPRILFSRSESAIFGLPIYFGVNTEHSRLNRATIDGESVSDTSMSRSDFAPLIRVPLTRWPFLTINSSAMFRATRWSESYDASGAQVEQPISRRYFEFQTRIVGPVFSRIFDTPGNSAGDRFKHVIEPSLSIRKTTAIDNFSKIVTHEYSDYVVGGVTRFTYSLESRLYAKRESAREIAAFSVSQTYYTEPNASRYDQTYSNVFGTAKPSNFSAVALSAKFSPGLRTTADARSEWDPDVRMFRMLSLSASHSIGDWLDTSWGWSIRRLIPGLPGWDNPLYSTHYINGSASLRTPSKSVGGVYLFNYDLRQDFFLQQRIQLFYNAQCCGVSAEWQTYNFLGYNNIRGIEDRRFNISFTLAGIGTFSNFLGAFGAGQPQRR